LENSFEVLCDNGAVLSWELYENGTYPTSSFVGGQTKDGTELIIAKYFTPGTPKSKLWFTPGYLHSTDGKFYMPFGGNGAFGGGQRQSSKYFVLTCQ